MKAWITKYALTSGIQEIEAEGSESGNMIREVGQSAYGYYHGRGKEWHLSYAEAAVRAEEMRLAKIKSVKKQLAKLEAMSFPLDQAAE